MCPKIPANSATDVVLQRHMDGLIKLLSFSHLALQPPSGVVFYSPLADFSLLACEVS